MALDGAFLNLIKTEIEKEAIGGRIDKIAQPSKEEIIITLRFKGGNKKLLLSANASSPRIHFTTINLENPKSPPMFCMLLRKHLNAGKLIAVRQNSLDRILMLDFETVNELGDLTVITLVMEIMGRHSNIILLNNDGKIIDSIKRITNELSSVRAVLPGMEYTLPPSQDKINFFVEDEKKVKEAFEKAVSEDVSKAVMTAYEGVSPILAREISYRALKGNDIVKSKLSDFYKNRIFEQTVYLKQIALDFTPEYTAIINEKEKLRDFTFIDITQYGNYGEKQKYNTASELLDDFYAQRDRVARMKQRSNDLLKLLISTTERITKKISLQEQDLLNCKNREQLKQYGDILNANLFAFEKGAKSVTLNNFYDENYAEVKIKLDERLTPAQNAQKYYSEYRKAATAESILKDLIEKSKKELIYIDSVFDAVSRTNGESELLLIREELYEQGYIKSARQKKGFLKPQPPIKYRSSDGFSILCGRNNKQNDQLTLKQAKNYDMWLHVQDMAGSHVIIENDGKEISDTAILEAAAIAAYNSKAQNSKKVSVDYTRVRNVKKVPGSRPGMVIFTDYYTVIVDPDKELCDSLLVK